MKHIKSATLAIVAAAAVLVPATSQAGSSYGFSFSTGGPAYYAPPPVYYAPPPPPPPVFYPAYTYRPYYQPYYRPAGGISFSYFGH